MNDAAQTQSALPLHPLFLKLVGRPVLLVGGGPVAVGKLRGLLDAGAIVTVVAPQIHAEIARAKVHLKERAFVAEDIDGAWLVIAAAPPEVNRAVLAAAEARRIFVNAVDDRASATAYAGSVLRREGVTVAISTAGQAPALAGLLREGFEALLPGDIGVWMRTAVEQRAKWLASRLAMGERRPALLKALNDLYRGPPTAALP